MSDSALALNQTVEENLVQLETAFQEQTDFVSIVQKLQGQLDELVRLMVDVPFWSNTDISLEDLARKTEAFDFYRLAKVKKKSISHVTQTHAVLSCGFKVKINFVANACLLICVSAGGWGTLVSCCLMYSFVFWYSLA